MLEFIAKLKHINHLYTVHLPKIQEYTFNEYQSEIMQMKTNQI